MLNDDVTALGGAGSALIIGLTRPDGLPHAARGCGLEVAPDRKTARVLMSIEEATAFGLTPGDAPGVPIAVTSADIGTLRSVQAKGLLLSVEAGDADDLALKDRYFDTFCRAIHEVDGIAMHVAERWRVSAVVRCRISIDELFVQTPGPGAGSSLGPVG